MAGAPLGNTNAAKAKIVYDAIRKAQAQDDKGRLDKAAQTVLTLASEGERWALEFLRDTLDGKPAQSVAVTGADEGPISHSVRVLFGRDGS